MFNKFNIALTVSNRFNIKNLIQANIKDNDPPNKKSGIYKLNIVMIAVNVILDKLEGTLKPGRKNIVEILNVFK